MINIPIKLASSSTVEIVTVLQCNFIFDRGYLTLVKEFTRKNLGDDDDEKDVYCHFTQTVKRTQITSIYKAYEEDKDTWCISIGTWAAEDMWVSVETQAEAEQLEARLLKYIFMKPWWKLY